MSAKQKSFWDSLFRNGEIEEHGENAWQNPSPTIFWVTCFISESRTSRSSNTQVLYHRGCAYLALHFLPPSRSHPACSLCSALRTFPLCSKKPLYRSLCLPGVPYFISCLWGIPSYPSEPTQMSAPLRLSLTAVGNDSSFSCSDAARNHV